MAIDMGCKPDAVIATATELMSFVTGGAASPPTTVAEPQAPVADAIAACGTALPASETAGLVLAEPTGEAPAFSCATYSKCSESRWSSQLSQVRVKSRNPRAEINLRPHPYRFMCLT